jgi:hypothetical protein
MTPIDKTIIMQNEPDWKLKSMSIRFMEYGEYSGKYVGQMEFNNKQSEAFTFNIRPEMAGEYLRLLKAEVVRSASELGEKLAQSLDLLTSPVLQIEQSNKKL